MSVLLIGLVTAPAAQGQTQSPAPRKTVTRADLDGRWSGTLVLDNSSPQLTLSFVANDSTLSGEVLADGTPMGPMSGLALKGDTVHFKVDVLDFTGVVKKTTMAINLIVYNGSVRKLTVVKDPPSLPH